MAGEDSALLEEPIAAIPPAPADAAPKRGPGRPKGSGNKTTSGTRARTTAKPNVRQACVAIVAAGNMAAVALRRWFPAIRPDDVLTDEESTLLADALVSEAQQSARIARWAERAGGVSAHAMLIQAAVLIATPRLQRRGILPTVDENDPEVRAMFERMRRENGYAETPPVDPGATVPVEARGTPFRNGAYGFGENDPR